MLFYPSWWFLPGYKVSVEKSRFRVELAAGKQIEYEILNADYQPQIMKDGSYQVIEWNENNLPAMKREALNSLYPGISSS